MNYPQLKNICVVVDPVSPSLPPFFCKAVLILDAELFLLSVKFQLLKQC